MGSSDYMSSPAAKRWHDIAYWTLLAVACAVFFVLNLWTSFKEDDMEFSLLRNVGFMDFLRSQYEHFMMSNGRCADFFATLFCAFLGKSAFNVCNTLVFGLMAHLLSLLGTGRRSVLALVMFITVVGTCYPVPGQTLLFVAGACNYMWAITSSLLVVYLLQRLHGAKLGFLKLALLMLLAFVAGNFNEATSFGFLGGLVLYYVFNRDKLDRNARWTLLAYFLGVLLIVASPGAWDRAARGGINVGSGFAELLASRCFIFAEKMVRIITPIIAVAVGVVALIWKGWRPVRQCVWTYVVICLAGLMFALGYLFERAYSPLSTVAFIIVVMAADYLLSHRGPWRWIRLLTIIFGLALSVFAYSRSMPVLHDLKVFEDNIASEIKAAPRHAILHEHRFNGYSRFAIPLSYVSATYFSRESTYCAYFDKDNVQFVDDSVYVRYYSGRLLDGAHLMPLESDRPEIADTVLCFPGQNHMIVVLNVDTLPPTPQIANYYLSQPDETLSEEDRQFRANRGMDASFNTKGFYPLYYQGKHLLVFPLVTEATSHIVIQLDYDHLMGDMTLRWKP